MSVEIKSIEDIKNLIGKEAKLKSFIEVSDIIKSKLLVSEYYDSLVYNTVKKEDTIFILGFDSAIDSYGVEVYSMEKLLEKFNEFTLDETSFMFRVSNSEDKVFEIDSELIDSIF